MNNIQHSNDFPDSFYRVSVKGLCVKDGKIFIMKESSTLTGQWESSYRSCLGCQYFS